MQAGRLRPDACSQLLLVGGDNVGVFRPPENPTDWMHRDVRGYLGCKHKYNNGIAMPSRSEKKSR
jgi:hypothetical protein